MDRSDDPGHEVAILSRRQQLAVGTITICCLCFMAAYWGLEYYRRGRTIDIERPLVPSDFELKIDLNIAPWAELTLLPEISETMARRVVEYRSLHGSFESLDEIKHVKGIGPRTFARIEPYLFPIQPSNATVDSVESSRAKLGIDE